MANANKVLLDSLVAQAADGDLMVGRGVPDSWLGHGQAIAVSNFPSTDGHRLGVRITSSGSSVTLTLSGAHPAGTVLFQLPAFVGNLKSSSAGKVDSKSGSVALPSSDNHVTVTLDRVP
jgi:hypothetical protein